MSSKVVPWILLRDRTQSVGINSQFSTYKKLMVGYPRVPFHDKFYLKCINEVITFAEDTIISARQVQCKLLGTSEGFNKAR